MPVTVQCAPVKAEQAKLSFVDNPTALFQSAKTLEAKGAQRGPNEPPSTYSETPLRVALTGDSKARIAQVSNGLVHTIEKAYSKHHHLVLRPDDVWLAILTQFSIYVNAHAEELRGTFVSHEGQKELKVTAGGTIESANFGAMAEEMGQLLQDNVKDPDLRQWIIPNFSTTTPNDTTVASVIMMATLKSYFQYLFRLDCGIPSVTLLGERADWEAIRARVDKFESFGKEPTEWAKLLGPVCDSFVGCFSAQTNDTARTSSADFWNRVCHYHSMGSGPTYLCGWLTVFCVWDEEGQWQGTIQKDHYALATSSDPTKYAPWPIIESDQIPRSVVEVPVKVDDNGTMHDTIMLAGLSGTRADINQQGESVLSPVSGWAMYEIGGK